MAIYTGRTTIHDYLLNESISDGDHTLDVNGVPIDIEMYNFTSDVEYTTSPTVGNTTADTRMLVLNYKRNLIIGAATTVTPQVRKKGMTIFVSGNLINNGTISMTARGANAAGQDIYLYKSPSNQFEFIPAVGAIAKTQATQGSETSGHTSAAAGNNGIGRQTGSGGPGAGRGIAGGTGAAGTSYSGGSGGGGSNNSKGGDGVLNGGAGGAGFSTSNYSHNAGGGAGNPGGAGYNGGVAGAAGTGGLLIIYADRFTNAGTISSLGSAGGNGYRAGGGGSGGGSINIFVKDTFALGQITVGGGARGTGTRGSESGDGGAGGTGTVTIYNLNRNRVIEYLGYIEIVEDINDLVVGKAIRTHYAAQSDAVGEFSNLGEKTSDLIPVASSVTPNGDFYWIVCEDSNEKKTLVADRNIQISISWDTLNASGITSACGVPITSLSSKKYITTIRILSGGVTSTDKDNEWDKYIVNSTLNDTIAAGDNNIWNWNVGTNTWTSTTISGTPASRVVRGFTSNISIHGSNPTNTATTVKGFRPVLIIEKIKAERSFIKFEDEYIKWNEDTLSWQTISTALPSVDTFKSVGISDLSELDRKSTTFISVMNDNGASGLVLGSGKVYKKSVDLKNLFEITNIKV
ncbi:hypothetical protein [Paenibacillus sp. FSL E2-0178]|uniref:hypothetical protein n=1 Tax=Paenibacillus sp. FSL E2-0178 TaxID=2921361 RepID=UPI0031590391